MRKEDKNTIIDQIDLLLLKSIVISIWLISLL
jgi:hypothetical protein